MAKQIKKQSRFRKTKSDSPFKNYWDKSNYLLLSIGIVVLVVGFYLMTFGPWDNPISLSVSPIVLLIAYLVIFPLSILHKRKNNPEQTKMFLAKIKGNLVATQKNEHLKGHKLLIVKAIDFDGNLVGETEHIALDLIDAGIGDTVLVAREGDAVQQILGNDKAPVNTMIIAIVDDIDLIEE